MEKEAKKNTLKMGRLELNLNDKKNGEKIVVIKPDDNQSVESKEIAKRFVDNIFHKDSPYKSGMASFTLEDWRDPENGGAKKMLDGIKKSPHAITWTDRSADKRVMKGIAALIPLNSPGGMDLNMGGSKPGGPGGFGGGFSSMSSMFNKGGGNPLTSLGMPNAVPTSAEPATVSVPTPVSGSQLSHHDMDDMKTLILMWEAKRNEI